MQPLGCVLVGFEVDRAGELHHLLVADVGPLVQIVIQPREDGHEGLEIFDVRLHF